MIRRTRLLEMTLGLTVLGLTACSSQDAIDEDGALSSTDEGFEDFVAMGGLEQMAIEANELQPAQGPAQVATYIDGSGQVREYTYQVVDGYAMSGDMILGTVEELEHRQEKGIAIDNRAWPNRTVIYEFHSSLTDNTAGDATTRTEVTTAMTEWTKLTGINFKVRNNESAYLSVREASSGCNSEVGYDGTVQVMNLASSCTQGNVRHEVGHAIGLRHEQSRCDRDTFLNIYFTNIVDGTANTNFSLLCNGNTDYGAYDRGSIMQYSSFTGNPPAIDTTKRILDWKADGSVIVGQRTAPSVTDVRTVRAVYNYHTFSQPRVVVNGASTPIRRFASGDEKDQFCIEQQYSGADSSPDDYISVGSGTWHAHYDGGVWIRTFVSATIGIFMSITCRP